jgi:predicted porin
MTSGLGRFTGPFAFCSVVAMMVGTAGLARADGVPRGGSCCADLEERIAELEATTARKGNRKVSLTISGQVTTALMAWDDGRTSDVYIVDPPVAGGTLFNLNGSAKISPSLSAGFHIQVGLDKGARSHQVTASDDDGGQAGDTSMVMTLANWYLDHKSLGRVTVGRINTATAGITGIDLGGTGAIANPNLGYWNRSFVANLGGNPTVVTWGDLLGGNTVNGSTLSRANAISYTSPTLGGFSVSAAYGEDNVWDVALRYAGEFSGFRLAAGIGYINNSAGLGEVTKDNPGVVGPEPSQVKGSVSLLHVATGLYVNYAYVNQDNDNQIGPFTRDTTMHYVQGGIAKNWTGLGNTVLYGEYARIEDGLGHFASPFPTTSDAEVWGLGVVQHIDAAAMELFLSYRRYTSDATNGLFGVGPTVSLDDMDVVMSGARIRF